MKFTLPWLKEHLDTDEPLAAIVDKLTMIGLEVCYELNQENNFFAQGSHKRARFGSAEHLGL